MDFTMNVLGDMAQLPAGKMVKELLLIDTREIVFLADNTGDVLQPGSVVLKPKAAVNRFLFAQNSCSFIETAADTDFGKAFDQALAFEISYVKQDAFVKWFANKQYVRFVAFIRDGNGNCFLVGTVQIGLILSIGKAIGEKIALLGVLAAQNSVQAASIATIEPSVLFADTDFGIDFSLDFNA